MVFKPYVSLEDPEERSFADSDPHGFLARFPQGAILDEVQRCPDLFSYLQGVVDTRWRMGEFILAGSQQFGLMSNITQETLIYPPRPPRYRRQIKFTPHQISPYQAMQASFSELEYSAKKKRTRRDRFPSQIEVVTPWSALTQVIAPHYPSSGGRGRPPIGLERMLRMYVAQQCFGLSDEGIEDALYDSQAIRRFVGIGLGRETAPDATTLLKFRRIMEEHHLTESIFSAINAHLADKGLFLREGTIVDATLIAAPPSTKNKSGERGALFETLVVSEWVKRQFNAGQVAELYFWRDSVGHEVDLLIPQGNQFVPVEIKSGATFSNDWTAALRKLSALFGDAAPAPGIVYGGGWAV